MLRLAFDDYVVQIAKTEQLKPMELELRKLEDLSESIVADFARMKQLEQEHRDTNRFMDICVHVSLTAAQNRPTTGC